MGGGRLLWGQILLVLGLCLAGIWAGSQWAALRLAYQPELGAAWFRLGDTPIYAPPSLFWWWLAFDAYAPSVFAEAGAIAAAISLAGCGAAVALSLWRSRENQVATTYGSARWARDGDLVRAGLFAKAGVVLGRRGRRYLRHDGPEHVLCFAPTRSGKGVGLVVPSLLTWSDSAVVHDIKGENWSLTAGWRARFGRVLRFDPTDPNGAAFNPLMEVRPGAQEVRDVQNIADILVDPEGSLERRSHWEMTSHALLVGAILHVLHAEPDKTLTGVARFLSDPARPVEHALQAMLTTRHLPEGGHPVVTGVARELLNKSPNERSGVISTALAFLSLYRDPVIEAVTSRCDWRIADLVRDDQPASLYLVVPPSDISRTRPVIRLLLNQIGRRLTESLEPGRRRVLWMFDEFPALGRLDFLESALAFMAGYGQRVVLIAQSLNQLEKAYGANNAILDNCHLRVAFAANDERTAKRISEALGTATERRAMRNYAGHRLSPWLGHVMISKQETARALLTPGEVLQLPPDQALVFTASAPPALAAKVRYFEDPQLAGRVVPPPASAAIPSTEPSPNPWAGRIATPEPTWPFAAKAEDASPRRRPGGRRSSAADLNGEFDFGDGAGPARLAVDPLLRQASLDPDDGIEL